LYTFTENNSTDDDGPIDSKQDFSAGKKPVKCISTDWSRAACNRLSLLKSASGPNQAKITDYFDLIDHVFELAADTTELQGAFACVNSQGQNGIQPKMENFNVMLKRLISNAIKNSENHHMEEGIILSLRNYLYHCTFSWGHWHITSRNLSEISS